jgi:hypothetical protein
MLSLPRGARLAALIVAAALAALPGCGDTGPRSSVKGRVTYDGVPVDEGSIAFVPADSGEGRVRATGAIEDGSYEFDSHHGPNPGKYRVEIYWWKKTGRQIPSPSGKAFKDEIEQPVPARYNEQTELTIDVQPGRNTCDFDLKK